MASTRLFLFVTPPAHDFIASGICEALYKHAPVSWARPTVTVYTRDSTSLYWLPRAALVARLETVMCRFGRTCALKRDTIVKPCSQ